mgnify:CR=1 FL=1
MSYLTSNQLKQYEDKGYVSPINIFSKEQAKKIRNEIELIEKDMPKELEKSEYSILSEETGLIEGKNKDKKWIHYCRSKKRFNWSTNKISINICRCYRECYNRRKFSKRNYIFKKLCMRA